MKINLQYYVICKICIICIWLHIFAYHTYFACDAYIVQVHLIWSKDAVNTDTTPVQRDRRQAQRGVQCIMVFIQKTSNFIWKHRKHCIFAHLSSIAMQNHFPSQSMVTLLWVPPPARKCVMKRRTLARFHMLIRMPEKSPLDMAGSAEGSFWNQRSALRGTLSPVLWSLTSQCFVSIINSRCNQQNMINMQNMSKIDKYAEYAFHIRKIQ